jgi:ferredoxin/flavodoxin
METTIYYFTGTGNSLEVARDLGARLSAAKPLPIAAFRERAQVTPEGQIIGLVFPVYDWNAPAIVANFVKKLDLSGVNYIFAVATCNFCPGGTLDYLNFLLREKGKNLAAGFVIRMPGNYLPFYGANRESIQQLKFRKKDQAVDRIVGIVRAKRESGIEHSGIFLDRLLASKFRRDQSAVNQCDRKFRLDPEQCNGCGICQKVCPVQNIECTNGKPHWLHGCEQCFACIQLCPQEAIQYGKNTAGRKRYRNPRVTLNDFFSQSHLI